MIERDTTLEREPVQVAGDPMPATCVSIEIRVAELKQLFHAMDPSPFRERDLDPKADEFIVGWAKEVSRNAQLGLLVRLGRAAGLPDEATMLSDAIHEYFADRAKATRQRLRELFRRGRISLFIGLLTLLTLLVLSDRIDEMWRIGAALRESLLIGGWVAMWRPLEIFLYDWWPIRAEARLYDRLSTMPVSIAYERRTNSQSWRTDWPAVAPHESSAVLR